jgi:RNA polymerase sigma-70 factor (ECF subfamily)
MSTDRDRHNERLSHISTLWNLVRQAHADSPEVFSSAREALMQRYGGAAHRYLLGALRDPEAADDLFQEFALRFVRGDFKNADPQRGRFRNFVKTALFHLVCDYHQRQKGRPLPLSDDAALAPATTPGSDSEQEFVNSWRDELMEQTWLALAELEQTTGQPCYTVLRCRTDKPQLSSAELADHLGAQLGKTFTVDGVRQALHRARDKFADLLLAEVSKSLEEPTTQELEQELLDLGLFTYCRSALERASLRSG